LESWRLTPLARFPLARDVRLHGRLGTSSASR